VGSKRMIVYDDVAPLEKIRVFDARVETPPHYDTFAEFQYAYHYGDVYVPYVKQEEPLRSECQHFLDCIKNGTTPLSGGKNGLELVQILEASSKSLRMGGAPVDFHPEQHVLNGDGLRNGEATKKAVQKRVPVNGFNGEKRAVKLIKKIPRATAPEIFAQ
jgi:hypothetical protein